MNDDEKAAYEQLRRETGTADPQHAADERERWAEASKVRFVGAATDLLIESRGNLGVMGGLFTLMHRYAREQWAPDDKFRAECVKLWQKTQRAGG
jgi:hypothetical protein